VDAPGITAMSEQESPRDHTGIMRPVCNENWERQRTLIKQLYLVQNMKLKDVMVVMERDHKFKATWVLRIGWECLETR